MRNTVTIALVAAALIASTAATAAATDTEPPPTEAERPVCPPGWKDSSVYADDGRMRWGPFCSHPEQHGGFTAENAWNQHHANNLNEPEDPPAAADPQPAPESPADQFTVEEVPDPEPVPHQDEQRDPQPQEGTPENSPLSAEEQAALEELLRCQQNPLDCEYAEESPQTVNWGNWGNPPANQGGCNDGWTYNSESSTCHADLSNPKPNGCLGPHCRIVPVNCNINSRSNAEKLELRRLHYRWGDACTDAPSAWDTTRPG